LPAVAAIREANPDSKITWVINPEWTPLLRGNRDVNHVHIFPRNEFRGTLKVSVNLLAWARKTSRLRPHAALDFQGLLRSAFIARVSRADEVWGMSDAREGSRLMYHRVARVDRHAHAVERYLKLAEDFGATIKYPLRFPLPTGDVLPHFDDNEPFVLLHPYARGRRKSLTTAIIHEFCRALAPARVVVVGRSHRKFAARENCIDLTNRTTLLQLIHLVRKTQFFISVDSGPMHIGAAIHDRLLSIHTWTDPNRVGPYNPNAWIWKSGNLLRVRDLNRDEKIKGKRALKLEDVPAIAELAQNLLKPHVPPPRGGSL
jgi:ADP-heptose:LPS heptosyltransferase